MGQTYLETSYLAREAKSVISQLQSMVHGKQQSAEENPVHQVEQEVTRIL